MYGRATGVACVWALGEAGYSSHGLSDLQMVSVYLAHPFCLGSRPHPPVDVYRRSTGGQVPPKLGTPQVDQPRAGCPPIPSVPKILVQMVPVPTCDGLVASRKLVCLVGLAPIYPGLCDTLRSESHGPSATPNVQRP